ncbi:MAG: Ni/Fe hydrogenase subunit alpha [Tepidimonas sp.]|uniref:Ni/Fe hydrogenase subunit alpha n=1 Tax=Tepidimonas sp. TaxID=2002775 RepID=UPI00298F36F9|nr:Ni/Fe hydrogenase subunit alpha [Tepidimonas sp.]MCS6811370.1 Ni/Fe hydrogenase subunit alpha [Tepidimonas sp.]MDW8335424.1 Ni/Fe hydrogenase subunit alpha [Tepidimonas sp.]
MTEQAASPAGLRRVAIDPLTRVEGHGKVTLLLDEHGHVQQARLHIVEFRGFEQFIVGRPYWEVPVLVQRLCGICPVSHHLAACKALDRVVGGWPVPPVADAIRRLMHHGQIVQSHALHFFYLASPDLLLGFDAEPARRHIAAVAQAFADTARQGVLLRKFGQEVIRITAGKRVHGTGSVPGGVNRAVTPEERAALRAEVPQMLAWAEAAVDLVQRLLQALPPHEAALADTPAAWLSLVAPDGALELYDGVLRVRESDGRLAEDGWEDQRYHELIDEAVQPWSYMKFPYRRALGPEAGWYRVGPLARVQNCDRIPTPRAEARRQAFVAAHGGRPVHRVLATHWARMIELLHGVEMVARLLEDDTILGDGPLRAEGARQRRGVGVIEAPRGTLIHDYEVGDDDRVTRCNLIVSTTHNNTAMNEAVRAVAQRYLDGRALTEGLLNRIEVAIRAYDPCLSCATHALGQMPLAVTLRDAHGAVLDHWVRDADGQVRRDLPPHPADQAA